MSELTSIVRHVGRRHDPHHASSDFWVGVLASAIGGHLSGEQPHNRLEQDYREFIESPCCGRELREILEPTKGKQ